MTFEGEEEEFVTFNEFRSDTFTVPSKSMKQAMIEMLSSDGNLVGDSVYKEDIPTLELESKMVELTGKPAALYCVSGTLSNQIGLRANLYQPPYSVLCDYRSHVFLHEAGGLASLSQAMVHPVIPSNGDYLRLEDIIDSFVDDEGDIHAAPTKLISLENTLHGIIMPIEEIIRISDFCKSKNIKLHLDGARLWNASVETGISIKEYCSYFDSVSLCLSKSLGAPMGSVLVGQQDFINKANHFKKQCGGGIRQNGYMAKMATIAIDENFVKIKQAHIWAKSVGAFCQKHNIILESPVDSNFVFIDLKKNQMNDNLLVQIGSKYNVKLMGGRIAFHYQLSNESIENLKMALLETKKKSLENPYLVRGGKKLYNIDAVKSRQQNFQV